MMRCVVAVVGLLAAVAAHAWGPHGHEVVAEVAARELSPGARIEVERLLGDRASNSMREAANWADDARNEPKWRHTGIWHYLNFVRGDCSYDGRDNCRGGQCVVAAIERETRLLADRRASPERRADALRFVIHFVGDVHQPLHAGFRDDRGGNDFQIRHRREGDNLHGFWDGDMFRAARGKLDVQAHADDLLARPGPPADLAWHNRTAQRWAEQSCRIVQHPDFYPLRGRIDPAYIAHHSAIADDQLEVAGHRLAQLLNTTLGTPR